jgi:hypothetical protein
VNLSSTVTRNEDGRVTITGLVDGREVISLDHDEDGWSIGMSANLPSDVDQARKHVEAFHEAFAKMDKLIAEEPSQQLSASRI